VSSLTLMGFQVIGHTSGTGALRACEINEFRQGNGCKDLCVLPSMHPAHVFGRGGILRFVARTPPPLMKCESNNGWVRFLDACGFSVSEVC